MGFFGGPHTDKNDSVPGMTFMMVLSDLPTEDGWDPGRFHLLSIGVYLLLEPFTVVFFTGRLLHGGTAPLSPPGTVPPESAYRLIFVGYPPEAFLLCVLKRLT